MTSFVICQMVKDNLCRVAAASAGAIDVMSDKLSKFSKISSFHSKDPSVYLCLLEMHDIILNVVCNGHDVCSLFI